MTVAVNDVVRATWEMSHPAVGAVQNVWQFRNEDVSVSDTQAVSDIVDILEAIAVIIDILIGLLQVVDGVRIINITPVPPVDVGFGTFADTTPFTGAGGVQAAQVAAGITMRTARLSVVGRKYLGLITPTRIISGGAINAGTVTILATLGTALVADFVETNTTWRAGVVASSDAVFLPFTAYSIPTFAITQRRRRGGVGI